MIPNAKMNQKIIEKLDLMRGGRSSGAQDDVPPVQNLNPHTGPIQISPHYMRIATMMVALLPEAALARYERNIAVKSN